MSMTEQTETPAENKPKKRRHARANKRAKKSAAPKGSPYEGITPSDCPVACNEKCCVITGVGFCAHPHKGGLQSSLQNPDRIRRYNEAKLILGEQKLRVRA